MKNERSRTMRFKLKASLPAIPEARIGQIVDCSNEDEAFHLAEDLAWDLYTQYEGTKYELPSFSDLEERYHGEWFDLIDSEFDRAITDLYVRTIKEQTEIYVTEAD